MLLCCKSCSIPFQGLLWIPETRFRRCQLVTTSTSGLPGQLLTIYLPLWIKACSDYSNSAVTSKHWCSAFLLIGNISIFTAMDGNRRSRFVASLNEPWRAPWICPSYLSTIKACWCLWELSSNFWHPHEWRHTRATLSDTSRYSQQSQYPGPIRQNLFCRNATAVKLRLDFDVWFEVPVN